MSETDLSPFQRYLLAELAAAGSDTFVDGPFGSSLKSDEYVDAGVRLIQLQNIGDGEWRDDNKKFITSRKFKSLERHGAIPGDIAIAKMADPVARACLVPPVSDQFVVVADCIRLRLDKARFDSGFVVRSINSPYTRREAEKKAVGSTRTRINLSVLKTIGCLAPGLSEQQTISRVLDTLDTAIHETEAIIAKLKAVKQGLLHDLLTRGIDANGELRPPQTEAPHLYKESPVGPIPREWNLGPLQTWLVGRPRNGYSPQEASEWTGVQMLGLGCLTTEGFEPVQLKPAPRGDRRLATAMLSDGDLLMSRSNTRDLVGLAGVYRDVGSPCSYPDLMMRLRPSPETNGEFLQFVLRSPRLRRQIQAYAVGTSGSMVKVSGKIVSDLMTAMPKMGEQEHILNCLAAGESRLRTTVKELSVLHELKSGLMNDLLTGRIRVTPLLSHQTT